MAPGKPVAAAQAAKVKPVKKPVKKETPIVPEKVSIPEKESPKPVETVKEVAPVESTTPKSRLEELEQQVGIILSV